MAALTLIAQFPLALDAEAMTGNSTGLAVISIVSMVFGYVALFALWWFVFRDKARAKRKRGPSD